MSSIQAEKLQICWSVDEALLNDLKQNNNELISDATELNGYEFRLKWKVQPNKDDITNLLLSLTSLPNEIGGIKISFTIQCNEISYFKQDSDIVLTIDKKTLFNADLFDQYESNIHNKIPLNALKNKKSLEIKCNILILIKYDLYGGIFSCINKPIFVKPTPFLNKLVYGYLDEIHNFDSYNIKTSPLSIYDLIYKYYLMILNVKNKGDFVWKFNNKSDVELFLNCKHGDVLTSQKFEINGCIFYLELTPNGWSSLIASGECAVWIAVDQLPKKVHIVYLLFKVCCDAIGYKAEKKQELTTPEKGGYSARPPQCIQHEKLEQLKKFEFQLSVEILSMVDDDGNCIDLDGNILENTSKEETNSVLWYD